MSEKSFVLLRHGIQDGLAPRGPNSYGIKQVRSTASELMGRGIRPDIALHSVAKWAERTAQIITEAYKKAGQELNIPTLKREGLTAVVGDVSHELRQIEDQYDFALLVSHDPLIRKAIDQLGIKDRESYSVAYAAGFFVETNATSWANLRPENVRSAYYIGFAPK